MADYGLTPNGPEIKRLDTILDEMHQSMSEKLQVNTRQNPQSLLNHLLTNIADRLAELWEFGESVYYSQYPTSAEGSSLDNAAQYGGSTRKMAAKSFYSILCTGLDGTAIPSGTIIGANTNPVVYLSNSADGTITREKFNKAVIVLSTPDAVSPFSVSINGTLYSANTFAGLEAAITDTGFTVSYADEKLSVSAVDTTSSNNMVLSENLTTESVSTIIQFATVEDGDIFLPNGTITNIIQSVAGLSEITNVGSYIAGRLIESDKELRQSYVDQIFIRSSSMIESVRSAILENVQGVKSVAAYENDTNVTDTMGRPPHSIEVVVDGGSATEIAQQILATKAGGISTYGDVETTLAGLYDENIVIRFNRPQYVYIWFQIGVTLDPTTNPPTNYAELIRNTIMKCMDDLKAGEDVVSQKFVNALYENVSGFNYFDVRINHTTDPEETPSTYPDHSAYVTARQRAITTESRIGVVIDV